MRDLFEDFISPDMFLSRVRDVETKAHKNETKNQKQKASKTGNRSDKIFHRNINALFSI